MGDIPFQYGVSEVQRDMLRRELTRKELQPHDVHPLKTISTEFRDHYGALRFQRAMDYWKSAQGHQTAGLPSFAMSQDRINAHNRKHLNPHDLQLLLKKQGAYENEQWWRKTYFTNLGEKRPYHTMSTPQLIPMEYRSKVEPHVLKSGEHVKTHTQKMVIPGLRRTDVERRKKSYGDVPDIRSAGDSELSTVRTIPSTARSSSVKSEPTRKPRARHSQAKVWRLHRR